MLLKISPRSCTLQYVHYMCLVCAEHVSVVVIVYSVSYFSLHEDQSCPQLDCISKLSAFPHSKAIPFYQLALERDWMHCDNSSCVFL